MAQGNLSLSIGYLMTNNNVQLSFEFFPPRTPAGKEKLFKTRDLLSTLKPEFFSMTYGAGGSTKDSTQELVNSFNQAGFATAPHLSFGGDSDDAIKAMLTAYKEAGAKRIVALRGDVPSGTGYKNDIVYANDLVAFIREHFDDHFHIEVAAYPEIHPEAKTYEDDIRYFKQKVDAGANSAITQYFYNPDAYFYFLDQCHSNGIDIPIYPGIMPILNVENLKRFSASCGAEIPRWLSKRLDSFENDDASLKQFSEDVVTELCETLLEGSEAPGLHFYTMNQAEPIARIIQNLGLDK